MPSVMGNVQHRTEFKRPASLALFGRDVCGEEWICYPHIKVICDALMDLMYDDEQTNLLVMCPPRHGKSFCCSYLFPAFYLMERPYHRCILTTYDTDFAEEWGSMTKSLFKEHGERWFGRQIDPEKEAVGNWKIKGTVNGGMIATGINSGITGKGANLLIVDDPIKNPEEAFSDAVRRRTWNNFVSVCMYRRQKGGKAAMLYTPWHEDDVGQTILRMGAEGTIKPWRVIRMPAIAETQESRDVYAEEFGLPLGLPDPIGRSPGEALCPQLIPLEQLLETQRYDPDHFESLYQGRPRRRDGSFFQEAWFKSRDRDQYVDFVPRDQGTVDRCRYWDRASSVKKGDYTAGVLVAKIGTKYYIEDIKVGRWSAADRDEIIRLTARNDSQLGEVKIRGEQEPGSSGKDAAENFVTMLDGYDVAARTVTGDKEARARALAAQSQIGNVYIVRGPHIKDMVSQFTSFPKGKHDDILDAASGAYNILAAQVKTILKVRSPTSGWYGRRMTRVG